ncbi:MAG: hypothetical protein ACYC9J_14650 [Sulfuricaulis sp.]
MTECNPKRFSFSVPFVVLVAFFLYRVFATAASGVTDPDYYWHVSYGEWMLDYGRLPTVDFWSWTFNGHPYRLTQWLGELLMGLANRLGGEFGTQFLSTALMVTTIAFSYRAARCFLGNRLAALAVALFCDTLLNLPCRPHQFTHLGLAILTAVMSIYLTTGKRRVLYWVPPVMALWVNLHGAYAVGLAYLWMMVCFCGVDVYLSRDQNEWRQVFYPLCFAAIAGTLATLINPYGYGAWSYAMEIANLKSSSAGIVDEWNPVNIKMNVGIQYFFVTTAIFVAMATSMKRPRPRSLLSLLALVLAGWSAMRVSIMMLVLLVPLLAEAFEGTALYRLAFEGDTRRFDRNISGYIAMPLLLLVLGASVLLIKSDDSVMKIVAEKFPVGEVAFMKAHHIKGRILNDPVMGGYLIRNLGQKVSIDTRLDLYGDQPLFDFLSARSGDMTWRDYIKRMDPDIVLLDNTSGLRQLLLASRLYRLVYESGFHSVLVRPHAYPELSTVQPVRENKVVMELLKR